MITAIVLGLGDRGRIYANYALENPNKLRIVAAADPIEAKRKTFARLHKLSESSTYESWENLLNRGKIADVAIITTPDRLHFDPAIKAMELGYDVLLEKPMAPTRKECIKLSQKSLESGQLLQICHVLRYTDFYSKMKAAIDAGVIGEVVNITMLENVSYFHYAHSYIRGNWHNREKASPMILAKCSHDLDIMYWFANSEPAYLSSFGGLDYFTLPRDDLPERCTDGCPIDNTCLYYAPRIYEDIIPLLHVSSKTGTLGEKLITKATLKYPYLKKFPPFSKINHYSGWPVSVISQETSKEAKRKALETGPYGKCVYSVEDHNVVDHQVVSLQFENNITGTLTMHGHSSEEGRYIRIEGTKGTILGEFLLSHQKLEVIDSLTNQRRTIHQSNRTSGHGGGDMKLMSAFVSAIELKKNGNIPKAITDTQTALVSHLMAFAADKARKEKKVVEYQAFNDQ